MPPEKIIIENKTSFSLGFIVEQVKEIIKQGRISANGTQHCLLTVYETEDKNFHIVTSKNEKSDKFTAYEIKRML